MLNVRFSSAARVGWSNNGIDVRARPEAETMNATLTIPIQSNLWNLLQGLGEPATIVPAALRQYMVDRYLQRVEAAEGKIAVYARQYQTDYATFNQRVNMDQTYLDTLNCEHPLWEADAIEWAHRMEEVEAWRERLNSALQVSLPLLVPG